MTAGTFAFAPVPVSCWAPAGSSGTRSSSRRSCAGRCTVRCRPRTTPVTACGWRWRTVPTWRTWARHGGCRSSRFPATHSAASRAAEACGSNAPGREASSSTGPASDSSTRRANTTRWRVRSTTSTPATVTSTTRRGSSSTRSTSSATASSACCPVTRCPTGSRESADLAELGAKTGIDPDGLARTLEAWNRQRRRRARPRLRSGLQRIRRVLGRRQGADPGGQDARPGRHGAVLRGAGHGGCDGHQGWTAHRPRRPRHARQR